LLRTGKLPHRKICGKIRFTQNDLQVSMDGGAVTHSTAQVNERFYTGPLVTQQKIAVDSLPPIG